MKEILRKNKKTILFGALFVGAMALVTVLAWPYIKSLASPATQEKLRETVTAMGPWGVLALFGLQVLQIVVAFIPGEPVEILAGVMYGGVGGTAICIAGCVLASSMVFWITRRFGKPLVQKLFSQKKLDEFTFLQESKKQDMAVFILFLLPGTPKDLLTYLVGLSRMRLSRFLLLSNLARIPSLVSSTFLGQAASQGRWLTVGIIFAVTAVLGIAGILLKDRVMNAAKAWSARHHEGRK